MTSDLNRPLLRVLANRPIPRPVGSPRPTPPPSKFTANEQRAKFGTKFTRLAEVMSRDDSGLELKADPTSLAPERLLVFELNGSVQNFFKAISKVQGLELVDEEELFGDEQAKKPIAYLLIPDNQALDQILRLWQHWLSGKAMMEGFTPWRDVFQTLRNLRPWGPNDRISPLDRDILKNEIEGLSDEQIVPIEIELIYRPNPTTGQISEDEVLEEVAQQGGSLLSRVRFDDIAYHAMLVEVPVSAISQVLAMSYEGISGLDPIQYIRPQSLALTSLVGDDSPIVDVINFEQPSEDSILGLIDGVPVARHPLLRNHLAVDDIFDLEPNTTLGSRRHGTAMASLIVHGDRNNRELVLPRKIHLVPVLGEEGRFPENRLIVDLIYQAVYSMLDGESPSAPHVTVINISLGNKHRPFHGQMSPWARLIDRLSFKYGVLFLVSAGNLADPFQMNQFTTITGFEDASHEERTSSTISALDAIKAERRLISPAETVNGLTIGAINSDWVPDNLRRTAAMSINPYPSLQMTNPTSAMGPGFAKSVKPEIILPGSREHLNVIGTSNDHIIVSPVTQPTRSAGLKVAAPPIDGANEAYEGYTNGTSAATALASRTAHRIHDALEQEYGDEFFEMPKAHRAVLLKALLVHPASWPSETARVIKAIVGPADGKQHVKQKDNIRRYLGFGSYNLDDAVACASDRATFWAVSEIGPDQSVSVSVPIPVSLANKPQYHSITTTIAWITPTNNGNQSYRTVRLKLIAPQDISSLGVVPSKTQPDNNQMHKGTVATRRWEGEVSAVLGNQDILTFSVERQPDQGAHIDENAIFAVAVTISMPGVDEIYDQVREIVRPRVNQPI